MLHINRNETVALKQVKMTPDICREGFPLTALREIGSLLELKHPNIIPVREMVVGDTLDQVYMVMDYMDHDLKVLLRTMKHPFTTSEVKCLMHQLLVRFYNNLCVRIIILSDLFN